MASQQNVKYLTSPLQNQSKVAHKAFQTGNYHMVRHKLKTTVNQYFFIPDLQLLMPWPLQCKGKK
jgi:hypothetical protein